MALGVGDIVDDRYHLVRLAGAGGFGEVFEAVNLALGTTVALKTITLDPELSSEARADRMLSLMDEARSVSRLRHPNVVTALDCGMSRHAGGSSPYLVLEWCAGTTLKRWLSAPPGPRSVSAVWELLQPIVLAIAHAHEVGIVHRDLKPSNVMLEENDGSLVPRVIDFGIAKAFETCVDAGSGATRTASPSSPCTPAYASPEQVVGSRTGPWTDVHALGLLFVELLTGETPYRGAASDGAVSASRPNPAAWGVDAGPFGPVIERALALQPRARFPNARALLAALAEAASELGLPCVPMGHGPALREDEAVLGPSSASGPASATVRSSRGRPTFGPRNLGNALARIAPPPPALARPSRRRLLAAASLGAITVLGSGVYLWRRTMRIDGPRHAHLVDLDIDELELRLRRCIGDARVDPIRRNAQLDPSGGMRVIDIAWGGILDERQSRADGDAGRIRLERSETDDGTTAQLEESLQIYLNDERERGLEAVYALEDRTSLLVSARGSRVAARVLEALTRGMNPTQRG